VGHNLWLPKFGCDLVTIPQNHLRSCNITHDLMTFNSTVNWRLSSWWDINRLVSKWSCTHDGVYIDTCKHVWCFSGSSDMNMIIQSRSQLDDWLVLTPPPVDMQRSVQGPGHMCTAWASNSVSCALHEHSSHSQAVPTSSLWLPSVCNTQWVRVAYCKWSNLTVGMVWQWGWV